MNMRSDRVFVSEKVFFCVTDLFDSPMILLNVPMFWMGSLKIFSCDVFKPRPISLVFWISIMVSIKEGILFKNPYKSYVFEMKDDTFFSQRIFGYMFVCLRFITRKSIWFESKEETYFPFYEKFHVVLRSKPTVSCCHSWFQSPIKHLFYHLHKIFVLCFVLCFINNTIIYWQFYPMGVCIK